MDDEKIQLQSLQGALERLGYRVSARMDSVEALADFKKDAQSFELVITDQSMPKITGVRLAEALLQIRPDLPIILCTGFEEGLDKEEANRKGIREFVMKPFPLKEISEVIRRALGPRDS